MPRGLSERFSNLGLAETSGDLPSLPQESSRRKYRKDCMVSNSQKRGPHCDDRLVSDVLGVHAAGDRCICSAFDNSPTVWEEGHLEGLFPEFEHEMVMPDAAMSAQAFAHLIKVNGSLVFV